MEKFLPYEKLSKKKKRAPDAKRRGTWGEIKPVTRQQESGKAYNRKKAQDRKKEYSDPVPPFLRSDRWTVCVFWCAPKKMKRYLVDGGCKILQDVV